MAGVEDPLLHDGVDVVEDVVAAIVEEEADGGQRHDAVIILLQHLVDGRHLIEIFEAIKPNYLILFLSRGTLRCFIFRHVVARVLRQL